MLFQDPFIPMDIDEHNSVTISPTIISGLQRTTNTESISDASVFFTSAFLMTSVNGVGMAGPSYRTLSLTEYSGHS